MAKVCQALAHTKSSERISEARALSCPHCDVSETVVTALPCKSSADVSMTVAMASPCESCANVSMTVAMALPCQSCADISERKLWLCRVKAVRTYRDGS